MQKKGIKIDRSVEHLDINEVQAGDVVLGTLPIDKVAEINARGARFLALCLDLNRSDRGRELTADDMDKCTSRLVEYTAKRL